ncbi:hypothetical protein PPROV_000328200 [Pycnococcus provasolii]|uniref:Flavin reductase like domain-containing protein n=1 Tax=Pycnococcus provasolii TaxID=41880 RepID=A0A830HCQ7_9CHLO|nr:hypothetical protein PPROV_000328200 [Pycnococcus provasolii]
MAMMMRISTREVSFSVPGGRRRYQSRSFSRLRLLQRSTNIHASPSSCGPPSKHVFAYLPAPVFALSTNVVPTVGNSNSATTFDSHKTNVCMVSYAAPVSINPPKFAMGVYKGTMSHETFMKTRRGVLAVLRPQHRALAKLLGKTSGRDVDKSKSMKELGFDSVCVYEHEVIATAAGVVELVWPDGNEAVDCGDHEVVICDVKRHWTAPDVVQDNACVALDVLSVREELGRQVAEAEAEASARTHTDLEGIPRVPDDLV